jgi:hypothetical protein
MPAVNLGLFGASDNGEARLAATDGAHFRPRCAAMSPLPRRMRLLAAVDDPSVAGTASS